MRIWRFVVEDHKLFFFGACHTFTLWPDYAKGERENW